jgi:hypothetical protein
MSQPTRVCAACLGGPQLVGTLVAYAGKMWCETCRPQLHPHPLPPVEETPTENAAPDPSLDN